jgi:hypothetical protein
LRLDWLYTADPTSRNLSLRELVQEPTIYWKSNQRQKTWWTSAMID